MHEQELLALLEQRLEQRLLKEVHEQALLILLKQHLLVCQI